MNEPLRSVSETAASETREASRSFDNFYDAESQTLFRRLWVVTGNRAEAEELMQDALAADGWQIESDAASLARWGYDLYGGSVLSDPPFAR